MKACKLLLAAAAATLLGALVTSASARTLSFTNQTFRATYVNLEFRMESIQLRCPLTLEGSLHSRMVTKVASSLIGFVTRAGLGGCSGNSAVTILSETLPWHLRYTSFSGVLPNIGAVQVRLIGFAFQIREIVGLPCLVRSTVEEPYFGAFSRELSGALTAMPLAGELTINNFECFEVTRSVRSQTVGTHTLLVPGTTTRVTLRLI